MSFHFSSFMKEYNFLMILTIDFSDQAVPESGKEIEALCNLVKPDVEERMKIQRIPWLEGDTLEIDDIYHPLSLKREVKAKNKINKEDIDTYENIFDIQEQPGKAKQKTKRRKILLKGDPGIGKTTLVSRMAYDWAVSTWNMFSLVFLISLKVINPGDPIENIIIDENITPSLYDENYDAHKIETILREHGEKCLLIFEGFEDRIDNQHVAKVIQGKKYRSCSFLVTTRPDAAACIKQYFDTVCTVHGFTQDEAKKYVKNLLDDDKNTEAVMNFTKRNQSIGVQEMWRYPILLLFICILVNDGNLDLNSRNVTLGEIYDSLLRCLYRRYITKRALEFDEAIAKETLLKLGKFALQQIKNRRLLYKKSEIEHEVGKEAFLYGIIIGYKDRKIVQDIGSDFEVCFLHDSIQEFLAAAYIVDELNTTDRKPEDIWPGVWDTNTISKLPLLLTFAIDLSQDIEDKDTAKTKLLTSCKSVLNQEMLEVQSHSIGASTMKFLADVVSSCDAIKNLTFRVRPKHSKEETNTDIDTGIYDDKTEIPNLVQNLSGSVQTLTFKECVFETNESSMDGSKQEDYIPSAQAVGPTRQIEIQCIDCDIPATSLKYIIANFQCIHTLHLQTDHVKAISQSNVGQVEQFYKSVVNILSAPLPKLKHLVIKSIPAHDEDPVVQELTSHENVFNDLMENSGFLMADGKVNEKEVIEVFEGNLMNIESVTIDIGYIPALMQEIITKHSPGNRIHLRKFNITGVNDMLSPSGDSFVEDILCKPAPSLEEFSCMPLHEMNYDAYRYQQDNRLLILTRNARKRCIELRTLKKVYTSCRFQSYLPSIKKIDLSLYYSIVPFEISAFCQAINGSVTLRQLKVNNLWMPELMKLLQRDGLPALQQLEFRHVEENNSTEVYKEDLRCLEKLPRVKSLDFSCFQNRFRIQQSILRQFFIALCGSTRLTKIDISGQNITKSLFCLLYKEGFPALKQFIAAGCNLQPGDMQILGDAVQKQKLTNVEKLDLSNHPNIASCLSNICKPGWSSLKEFHLHHINLDTDDICSLIKAKGTEMPLLSIIVLSGASYRLLLRSQQSDIKDLQTFVSLVMLVISEDIERVESYINYQLMPRFPPEYDIFQKTYLMEKMLDNGEVPGNIYREDMMAILNRMRERNQIHGLPPNVPKYITCVAVDQDGNELFTSPKYSVTLK